MDLPEEISHQVLGILESEPEISQRELADRLGISLGRTNYVLKGLLEKGWVKTRNFKNSKNKWAYAYFLTPEGIVEKGRITARYIKRKVQEYESLRKEVEGLREQYGELFEQARREEDRAEDK